jgi:hypothetical protein
MLARMWGKRISHTLFVGRLISKPLWKAVWRLHKKLNIELPCVLTIPLLGIYLKDYKSVYNKGTCTLMFIAALFTIVKLWKHPGCPTTDVCIKQVYLYTLEFYSATKKNEILSFASKCMKLENIILGDVSQVQKAKSCMFSLICGIQT